MKGQTLLSRRDAIDGGTGMMQTLQTVKDGASLVVDW